MAAAFFNYLFGSRKTDEEKTPFLSPMTPNVIQASNALTPASFLGTIADPGAVQVAPTVPPRPLAGTSGLAIPVPSLKPADKRLQLSPALTTKEQTLPKGDTVTGAPFRIGTRSLAASQFRR